MEEAELVKQMIAGDRDAFTHIMERYQPHSQIDAYLITGNNDDSENIVHET